MAFDGSIKTIISGGQTGVDRSALDFAMEHRLPHGGYCPKGRLAEDGTIPERYPLVETATGDYAERTEKNVLAADGTLIFYRGEITGGTQFTQDLCGLHKKPVFVIDLRNPPPDARKSFAQWVKDHHIQTLNVAGSRESQAPGIHAHTKAFLEELFTA